MVGLCAVAYTCHREVVVGEESVGYRLVERQLHLVVHGEHAVRGLRTTEESRVVHILYAAVYGRIVINLRVVYHARTYGAQVVALILQVVHKPAILDGAGVCSLYHLGVHAVLHSLVVESLVVVVAHERCPVVVAARRRLILKHDAMEVVVVHIESVNHYVHVMLLYAVHLRRWQLGVVCPVVGRLLQVHVRSRGREVYAERHVVIYFILEVGGVALTLRLQHQSKIVVVHHRTLAHFECLGKCSTSRYEQCSAVTYRCTIDEQLCSVRIAAVVDYKVIPVVVLRLRVVAQIQREVSRLARRNILDEVLLDSYLRHLHLNSSLIYHVLSRLVVLGLVFALVRTRRSAATSLEDERREGLTFLVLHILVVDVLVAILISCLAANVYREVVGALLCEHKALAVARCLLISKLAAMLRSKFLVDIQYKASSVKTPAYVGRVLCSDQQTETRCFRSSHSILLRVFVRSAALERMVLHEFCLNLLLLVIAKLCLPVLDRLVEIHDGVFLHHHSLRSIDLIARSVTRVVGICTAEHLVVIALAIVGVVCSQLRHVDRKLCVVSHCLEI